MKLDELVKETLVEKHRRLMRAKCKHEPGALVISTYMDPDGFGFTDKVCVDCGEHWRTDNLPPNSEQEVSK